MQPPSPILRAAQAAVARRGGGRRAYGVAARAVGALLVRAAPGSAVYQRGGEDVLAGVSDLDLVHVVPDWTESASGRARRRLRAALPGLRRLLSIATYEQRQLRAAVVAPAPLYPGPLAHRRPYLEDELWLRARPGLYGPTEGWRRVAGAGRLPAAPVRDEQHERVAAWLELQWWWRHLIAACLEPGRAFVPSLLGKLVAEPVRVFEWLEHRERLTRREALDRAAELEPEAAQLARRALRSVAPLGAAEHALLVAACARLSARVAAQLERAAGEAGTVPVRLRRGSTGGSLPLADARALTAPPRPFERITLAAGSVGDPGALAAAARESSPGRYLALREAGLLVVPTDDLWPSGWLRTLQCPVTDPVSFALLEGQDMAAFPELAGWSAAWIARRAVDEHSAWLEHDAGAAVSGARAALFALSLAAGEGELCLDEAALGDAPERAGELLAAARRLPSP
jgi:hypothetical protein